MTFDQEIYYSKSMLMSLLKEKKKKQHYNTIINYSYRFVNGIEKG